MGVIFKTASLVVAAGIIWIFHAYYGPPPAGRFEAQPLRVAAQKDFLQEPQRKGADFKIESAVIQSGGGLNLNEATVQELESLPGIGPKLAAAIAAFRDEHGGFEDLEQLKQVSGIGEKRFSTLSQSVTVERGKLKRDLIISDLNQMDPEALEALPGIGPKLAAAIAEFRDEYGAFEELDQLMEVRGIGEKRLGAILKFLSLQRELKEASPQSSVDEE